MSEERALVLYRPRAPKIYYSNVLRLNQIFGRTPAETILNVNFQNSSRAAETQSISINNTIVFVCEDCSRNNRTDCRCEVFARPIFIRPYIRNNYFRETQQTAEQSNAMFRHFTNILMRIDRFLNQTRLRQEDEGFVSDYEEV